MATKTKTPATLESLFEQPVAPLTGIGSTKVDSSPSNPTPDGRLQPKDLEGELMSVKAAAELLGLSLSSISHHVKQGHITALTVGTSSILLRWSVDEFKANRAVTKEDEDEAKKLRERLKALKAKRTLVVH